MTIEKWKVVKCPIDDLEEMLNILVKEGWHVWPQQIHIISPECKIDGLAMLHNEAVIICNRLEIAK